MRVLNLTDRPNFDFANFLIKKYTGMGIFFNVDKLTRLEESITLELKGLENEIVRLTGTSFNYNSSAQYAQILIDRFGVPPNYLRRQGKTTVTKDVLAQVQKDIDLPIIDYVNRCKTLNKQLSAINGPKGLKKYLIKTTLRTEEGEVLGAVIPKISRADTGRYQYSNPSIGNMGIELMETMSAPDGYYLVSLDIKQQEPTILFNGVLNCEHFKKLFKEDLEDKYISITKFCIAQDKLIEKIEQYLQVSASIHADDWVMQFLKLDENGYPLRSKDLYIYDYERINNYVMEHVIGDVAYTKEDRAGYKLALLSGSYGASEATIKKEVGERIGGSFFRMLDNLPELVEYKQLARKYLVSSETSKKEVYTLFGTILTIPEKDSKGKPLGLNAKLRCMVNYPTQGTGADMLKFAICDFYEWTKSKGLTPTDARIVTTRHDELVIMIRKELIHLVDEIRGLVELQVEDWSPILADVSWGTHYVKN